MTKLVKIVDNKYVQIEEYRNPNICFNTNEYDNFEDYCTLRETFDPFEMFYENQELKKQLEYLRSGEYYNQLRFERDMLQNVVDKKEISKEDKEFIDMTQRNTELLEENQKLKKLLEEKNKPQIFIDTQDMEERYAEGLYQDYLEEENKKYKNQQKEFISYLEYQVKLQEELNDKLLATGFEEILSKYKSIIGGKE